MSDPEIVLVSDRSLMSNFRGNYILGFLSCAPTSVIPDLVYDKLFAPPVEANPDGTSQIMPMGLRRLESGLINDGYSPDDIAMAHPDHVDKVVGEGTEIVGVNAMDPLGKGPVTSSFTHGNKRTPMNAVKFRELHDKLQSLDSDHKTVQGGGGAWQIDSEDMRDEFDIDVIVHGEAGYRAGEIFDEIKDGGKDTYNCDSPKDMSKIPEIRGPTINGLLESMRGCGRGCDFCGPDMRRDIYADPERLKREAKLNAEAGFNAIWLHSEDILLYKRGKHFEPNRDAILKLYDTLLDVDGIKKVGSTHMSLAAAARAPDLIEDIADINDLGPNNWTGVQPGIETASPRLIEMHLAGKVVPYDVEEWPEVIKEGVRVLNSNYMYPACTLIVGLPGEKREDVRRTIDVIEDLDDAHAIFAPLMYMDYGTGDTLTASELSDAQWELFYKCWQHNKDEFKGKSWKATKGWNIASRVISRGLAWAFSAAITRKLDDIKANRGSIKMDTLADEEGGGGMDAGPETSGQEAEAAD
ncbi:MAG: radical SAM protein [Halobacteria archaeon]